MSYVATLVKNGFVDERNDMLYLKPVRRGNAAPCIYRRQLRLAKARLERGIVWWLASPMYKIDREDAAALMTCSWDRLGKKNT